MIPTLAPEAWRRPRREFVLDLSKANLFSDLASNHRRNVRRAEKAGLSIHTASGLQACHDHVRLLAASMDRRRKRGEEISALGNADDLHRLMENRAGVLYQARLSDATLSSVFVLMSSRAAYYQSAGTSPDGMSMGASHFIIFRIAEDVRAKGLFKFNLGGVSIHQNGLMRFKMGFGTYQVPLEAVRFLTGGKIRRTLIAAVNGLRNQAKRILRRDPEA